MDTPTDEPPEQGLYKSLLEQLEPKRRAERALRLFAKPLDEKHRALAGFFVEEVREAGGGGVHFTHEPLINGLYSAAGHDAAARDLLPIFADVVHASFTAFGFMAKFISASPAFFFSGAGNCAMS